MEQACFVNMFSDNPQQVANANKIMGLAYSALKVRVSHPFKPIGCNGRRILQSLCIIHFQDYDKAEKCFTEGQSMMNGQYLPVVLEAIHFKVKKLMSAGFQEEKILHTLYHKTLDLEVRQLHLLLYLYFL